MKQLSLIITAISMLATCLISSTSYAGEKAVTFASVTASSSYSSNYTPEKALDKNNSTYWIGARAAYPWWIIFDAGKELSIGKIDMQWYLPQYTPTIYDIHVSSDASTWDPVSENLPGVYNDTREINHTARYIKLTIHNTMYSFPVLREFTAYTRVDIPRIIRFQGSLSDSYGVLNEPKTVTFRIYDAETSGDPLWVESQEVNIVNGVLDVELGSNTELKLTFDRQYWLGVEISGDTEMTPRFKLTSVPYSFVSGE